MYYEEQNIGGVLCYRDTPNGEWKQFSKVELTKRIATPLQKIVALQTIQYSLN